MLCSTQFGGYVEFQFSIGEILSRKGYCSKRHIEKALKIQQKTQKKIGVILLEMRAISKEQLVDALFDQFYMNSYLQKKLAERESQLKELVALDREISLAHEIQQSLLPTQLPEVAGLDVAGTCIMASKVGGDYFDVYESEYGCYNMVLADVAGHGIASSMVLAGFRGMLRVELQSDCMYLEGIAGKINRMVYEDFFDSGLFITGIFLRYEPDTHTISFVNAGHPSPLSTLSSNTKIFANADLPLGILYETQYTLYQTTIADNECILIFSDGLVEGCMRNGRMYGMERLQGLLHAEQVKTSKELVASIVKDFQGKVPEQTDDVTLLVIWKH
jgi:sigma-B regulation protein RsbU (phosphoserine phosphatase)